MEWTKIKSQYFLYSDYTLIEHGALSRLLILTAHLERIPTVPEIRRHIPEGVYNKLATRMQERSTPIADVLQRVLEDVERVKKNKEKSRQTSQKYRDTHKTTIDGDMSRDDIEKRREEKRREEKINKHLYIKINSLIAQGKTNKIDIINDLVDEYSEHDIVEAWEHIQYHKNKEQKDGK